MVSGKMSKRSIGSIKKLVDVEAATLDLINRMDELANEPVDVSH